MKLHLSLAAVVIVLATAAAASAQTPTQDSVTGSTRSPFFVRTDFDARSGPSGENPSGQVQFIGGGDFTFGGPVTCLNVRGNVATFNMQTIFGIVGAEVTDNAASGTPDVIRGVAGQRDAADCSPFGPNDGPVIDLVTSGDLQVVDAQPPPPEPASAADCRGRGYARFGFKSVGECLVYVVTARVCKLLERRGHVPKFCPPRLPVH